MRKLTLFVALLLLALPMGTALAVDDATQGAAGMARYFPESMEFFAAVRTDDAYVSEFDGVFQRVLGAMPEGTVPPDVPGSLREILDMSLTESGTSYAKVREWLGDYAAMGIDNMGVTMDDDSSNDNEAVIVIALELNNAEAFKAFFESSVEADEYSKSEAEGATLYTDTTGTNPGYMAVSDSLMIMSNVQANATIAPAAALVTNPGYQQSLSTLPEQSYNIVVYLDYYALLSPMLNQPEQAELFQNMGVDLSALRSFAMGFTILDGRSFTMDIGIDADYAALGVDTAAFPPVDPAFGAFVPAGTEVLIHSTDLSTNYINSTEQLATMMEQMEPESQDPVQQVENAIALFTGINLRDDILPWTTGDYAIAMDVDFDAFMALANAGANVDPMSVLDPLPFGLALLFEATDPAQAAAATEKVVSAVKRLTASEEAVSVAPGTVGGNDATIISITTPLEGQPFTLELVVGSNNDVFFFGTKDYIEAALSGGGLTNDPVFQDASQYFLPDANSVIYTNDDGLLAGFTVPILTLLGPAIGNVFDNIVEDLNASIPDSSRMTIQNDPMAELRQAMEAYRGLIASSSITSSYANGTSVRMVITLE